MGRMRLWCILLALSRALACNYHFGNLAYLNPTQLKLYNLKNCTVTCKTFVRPCPPRSRQALGTMRGCTL